MPFAIHRARTCSRSTKRVCTPPSRAPQPCGISTPSSSTSAPPTKTADGRYPKTGTNSRFSTTPIPTRSLAQNEEIPYPAYTQELDYELEIAAVIGKAGVNIQPEDAPKHIFGYTIFNDWSARDVQREEMKVRLGPAKGKDFASSLGPVIATAEEFGPETAGKPGVHHAAMMARVNGEECSHGNFSDIYWSFGQIIARASEAVMLNPGDVIGSGTVGTGCLLELTKGQGPWLQPGDKVELEIEGIGTLMNRVSLKE